MVAFGVAFMAFGVGIVLALIGFGLRAPVPTRDGARPPHCSGLTRHSSRPSPPGGATNQKVHMTATYSTRNAWASGLMLFAAAMLLTVGLFQILQAIAALANDDIVVGVPSTRTTSTSRPGDGRTSSSVPS